MFSPIPLGYDCSAASALRDIGLRQEAYPFDWVQSRAEIVRQCILDGFARYHKEVRLMEHGRRVIDAYGVEYPHDYPVRVVEEAEAEAVEAEAKEVEHRVREVGEAGKEEDMYMEEMGRPIVAEWQTYCNTVQEKYQRRIQRFLAVMACRDKPIIFFTRYRDADARELLRWLRGHYQREDMYLVNTDHPTYLTRPEGVVEEGCVTMWTERNGIWNESVIWQEGIDAILRKYFL